MSYMKFDGTDVITLSDFAKKFETTSGAIKNWLEADDIKPFARIGNTNLYSVSELEGAFKAHSKTGKTIKSLGYIHPAMYKALQDQHSEELKTAESDLAAYEERIDEQDALIFSLKQRLELIIVEREELKANLELSRETNDLSVEIINGHRNELGLSPII